MTWDALDRLLATRSSHRLADICAFAFARSDPTSPTLRYLAIQSGCPSQCPRRGGEGASSGRVGRMVGAWGPGSPSHRLQDSGGRESVEPQWLNLTFKRRCALVGLDATEFAAHDLSSACLRGCAPEHPVPWTMQQWQLRSVQQVPGCKSEADPGLVKASRLTLKREVRLIRAVVVS